MRNVAPWIEIFSGLANIRVKYETIKQNEDKRNTSVELGWKAIVYCFWLMVFTFMAIGLIKWGTQYLNNIALIVGVVAIILGIIFAVYIPVFLLFALSCSIKQIKLNKKPIGIIALVLTLILIVCAVVFAILVVQKF